MRVRFEFVLPCLLAGWGLRLQPRARLGAASSLSLDELMKQLLLIKFS